MRIPTRNLRLLLRPVFNGEVLELVVFLEDGRLFCVGGVERLCAVFGVGDGGGGVFGGGVGGLCAGHFVDLTTVGLRVRWDLEVVPRKGWLDYVGVCVVGCLRWVFVSLVLWSSAAAEAAKVTSATGQIGSRACTSVSRGEPSILVRRSRSSQLCTKMVCHARLCILCCSSTREAYVVNVKRAQLANIDDVPSFSSEPPDEAVSSGKALAPLWRFYQRLMS